MAFDAHEERVMSLFNRKVYCVPRNQRRYVWNKDNWQELFDDVLAVVNGTFPSHFIGSIVLKTDPMINGLPHYSVIDGQQRIITIAIFLSSIMFWMKKAGMNDDFRLTDIVNKFAARIDRDTTDDSIVRFVEELRKKLPTESMFLNAFKNVGWTHGDSIYSGEKNKTRVQTVLEIFERFHNNGLCAEDFTIEHVLPDSENTANGQIGNLLPLGERLNKRCEDKRIEDKLPIYTESAYSSARRFSSRFSGEPFLPDNRTAYMAKEFYEKILKL